jgi:hypothetical protein
MCNSANNTRATYLLPPLKFYEVVHVYCEVLAVVQMKIVIFWDMTPCRLLCKHQGFTGAYCLRLQGSLNTLTAKFRNIGTYIYQTKRCHIPEYWGLRSKLDPRTNNERLEGE